MRVAYVLPPLVKPSGWRTMLLGALRRLRTHVQPTLFVDQESLAEAREFFPGLPIVALPGIQTPPLSSRVGLKRLSASYLALRRMALPEFDLVHSFETYPAGLVGHWLAQKNACPHVLTAVGTYSILWRDYVVDRFFYGRVLRAAAMICPISPQTGQLLQQHFAQHLHGVEIRPILIGTDAAARVPRQLAFERPAPRFPTLLSVGDVKARKGQHTSLAAFASLKPDFPELRYRIVGAYEPKVYFQLLQDYIHNLQLQDVEFLGKVSEDVLRREYQNASVFVLTPQQDGFKFEGFGLVYLE
ncbi:MAG TPA: glycosyltransferase family 4 protein, partial [Anaerolineales bacterium]|nr:glycosyltransferase family 4 protein [Anaerolineales bacterium]